MEHKDHTAHGSFPDEHEYADFRHMIIKRPGGPFPISLYSDAISKTHSGDPN